MCVLLYVPEPLHAATAPEEESQVKVRCFLEEQSAHFLVDKTLSFNSLVGMVQETCVRFGCAAIGTTKLVALICARF